MDVRSNLRAGAALIIIAALAVACSSKFGDTVPTSEDTTEFHPETRLEENEALEQKLARIDQGITLIHNLFNRARLIMVPLKGKDVYTPIDFLADVNTALKNSAAEKSPDGFVKIARLDLPFKNLSADCRSIDVKFESSDKGTQFSVKTCKTAGSFQHFLSVEMIQGSSVLEFDKPGLDQALGSIFTSPIQVSDNCRIESDPQTFALQSVKCEKFVTKLSDSEDLVLRDISYVAMPANPNQAFHLTADITENDVAKFRFDVPCDRSLKCDLRSLPTESK